MGSFRFPPPRRDRNTERVLTIGLILIVFGTLFTVLMR